jgi:hypothetical protein
LFIFEIEEAFSLYYLSEDNPQANFKKCFNDIFSPAWEKYSMKFEGLKIKESSVLDFFEMMKPPMGYHGKQFSKFQLAKEINSLKLIV